MSTLPFDIVTIILERLTVKSLLRFKCVCKPWCCLINDPLFIKRHLNTAIETEKFNIMFSHHHLHSIEYDSFEFNEVVDIDYPYKNKTSGCVEVLSGSCNGLMLGGIFFLWNPSTKEFKKLPKTYIEICEEIPERYLIEIRNYGLGYDHTADDYKVVRIAKFNGYQDNYGDATVDCEVKVYTLGTNSWKNVADVPQNLLYDGQSGVYVNGALHWLAFTEQGSEFVRVMKDHDDLVPYDPKSQKVKTLGMQDIFSPGFEAEIYVGSLVSLNSGTYVEGKGERMNTKGEEDELLEDISCPLP
ncbi:hypothetical protein IFM89_002473 [Coptis chinensis]|uniref:F-box domain-containing protein n=1 Tax=Coptis chinensis TaxID=261450 RepID=A0A835HIN2_9MAGN|nr:hypothetical protein IFM89_002473 [Coptis chinensis]